MMISVGKAAERFLEEGTQLYAQRIGRYAAIEFGVVPEERVAAKGKKAYIREKESQRIREKLPAGSLIIGLEEKGKSFSSQELARTLGKWMEGGWKRVVFMIGGPYGLSEALKEEAHLLLSLSPMTLTHGMAKLLLLEQIYRAFTLLRGEAYHK